MTTDLSGALPGLTRVRLGGDTTISTERLPDGRVEVTASAPDGLPRFGVEVDLGAAVGYWQPAGRTGRLMPPDWQQPQVTSLIRSAPLAALYDARGRVLLGWAAAEATAELTVVDGVSEERKAYVMEVQPVRPLRRELVVVLESGDTLDATVPRLARWIAGHQPGAVVTPPAVARRPVYSTWYTFTQDVDADLVTAEAALAADLGCGSVFVDDGWQALAHGRGYQGCGDWVPDPAKFPDLPGTVRAVNDLGPAVALWIAPLLLGRESAAYGGLADAAPHEQPGLNCHVLDPRLPRVRSHVAQTCLRLVAEYGADLLKIDFLEQAMVYTDEQYAGTHGVDLPDVGEAMAAMLAEVRARLDEAGHREVAFEFRQPYVSPAIARFGEILRAGDCPADSVVNRFSTVDARLAAFGQVVHADPMMWGPHGGPEAVAQQLYAGWFAVPQLSMRLAELDAGQADTLRRLLGLWQEHAEVTLDGVLSVNGTERGYDLVRATRTDLSRQVVVRYAPVPVELDTSPDPTSSRPSRPTETVVLNATTDQRLLIETSRPIVGGRIDSLDGTPVGTVGGRDAGLHLLEVPAYGRVTLRT